MTVNSTQVMEACAGNIQAIQRPVCRWHDVVLDAGRYFTTCHV